MKTFKIGVNDAGQRLDKFIVKITVGMPSSLINKMIRKKRVKINGKRCENKTILNTGDILELYINDEFFKTDTSPEPQSLEIKFQTIYEDENILIVDKPAGLQCHSGLKGRQNTLINQIKQYLQDKGDYTPEQELSFSPALCNRLDINTQGLVIAAKNAAALRVMNEKIKNREVEKTYLCAVSGVPYPKQSVLTGYLSKDTTCNKAVISESPLQGSRQAITEYKVLRSSTRRSLVEVKLHTGRFHQIRAHMASIGHPLIGDRKYGGEPLYPHQLLCANSICFDFTSDAGILQNLNQKVTKLHSVWFENMI